MENYNVVKVASMGNIDIAFIVNDIEKLQQAKDLWQECFHDPEEFADYYFAEGAKDSSLLAAIKGNEVIATVYFHPYEIMVPGGLYTACYIVGVAVKESYRRQGVMTAMMKTAHEMLKQSKKMYSFLMPEKQEYYTKLGYKEVYKTKEYTIEIDKTKQNKNVKALNRIPILDLLVEEPDIIISDTNLALREQYDYYVCRDEAYFEAMVKEHLYQNGDAFCLYDGADLQANFACAVYDDTMYIERMENFAKDITPVWNEILSYALEREVTKIHIITSINTSKKLKALLDFAHYNYTEKDGKGIMMHSVFEFGDEDVRETFLNKCFFDEIV